MPDKNNFTYDENFQKSEELFRQVFEHSPIGIVVGTMDGGFLRVNQVFSKMIGYTKRELSTMTFHDITYPEDLERQIPIWDQCIKGDKKSYKLQKRYIRKSGEIIWVNVYVFFIYDDKKMPQYPLAMIEDITEQKRVENALRESEERARAQYHGNPIPVYTWQKADDDFILVDSNTAAKKITRGYIDKILGIKLSEMYKDRPQIVKEIWKCYNEKAIIKREIPYKFSFDNRVRIFNTYYSFSPPDLVLVHTEDITKRKRAEEELRRYRIQLESQVAKRTKELRLINEFKDNIISTIPSAIMVINKKCNIVAANTRLFELFAIKKKKITGLNLCDILGCRKHLERCHDIRNACLSIAKKEQKTADMDCVIQTKAREKTIHIRICRMVQEKKERFLLVIEDVTKNRLLERQLLLSERLVATGRLAASVAHEINNPLQGMSTHLDIIKDNLPENFSEKESYFFVKDNIHRIKTIVRQLFDIYRDPENSKNLIDINGLINKVIALIRNQMRVKGIRLELNLDKDLPQIQGWQQQLHQVLLNLLLNAVDSIKKGGVIGISTCKVNHLLTIKVQDTGRGIDEELLDRIFDPFVSTKGKAGVGLGLFVCQGFIQNHKGTISVKSEVGKGSTFTVTLPME
ncbi:MAG: PAS domain S-box protein [bacterium]